MELIIKTQTNQPTNGDIVKAVFPTCRPVEGTLLIDTDIAVFEPDWWNEPYKPVRIEPTCGNCKHFSGEHACCRKGRFVNWNHRDIRIECPDWEKGE